MTEKGIPQKLDDRPTLKHLNKYVRDNVCAACYTNPEAWKDLGRELIPDADAALGTIAANARNVITCCSDMLQLWLDRDPEANWGQLIKALEEVELCNLAATIQEKLEPSEASASGHATRTTPLQIPSKRSSSVKKDRTVENKPNDEQSSATKKVDSHDDPKSKFAVGKQQNDNSTNGNHPRNKGSGSATCNKTIWITLTILTVSVVILAIYIPMGLQQKQEDTTTSVLKSTHQEEVTSDVPKPTGRGNSKRKYEMLRKHSDELANILPVNNIINKLISAKIITFDDGEEIKSLPKSQDRASFVLNLVAKSLQAGITDDFDSLLEIMDEYGGAVAKIANKIRKNNN